MFFTLWHLRNILFAFSIDHRGNRYEVIIGVGVCPIIAEAIVVHAIILIGIGK